MHQFFEDEGFNFAPLLALGLTYRGLADIGEVLSTVARIEDGDREQWVEPFSRDSGANWHCEPAAQGRRDERVFDWLEDVLGAVTA